MKIDDLIKKLRSIKKRHGNVLVVGFSHAMVGGEPVAEAERDPGGFTTIDETRPLQPGNIKKVPPSWFVAVGDRHTYEGRDW